MFYEGVTTSPLESCIQLFLLRRLASTIFSPWCLLSDQNMSGCIANNPSISLIFYIKVSFHANLDGVHECTLMILGNGQNALIIVGLQ